MRPSTVTGENLVLALVFAIPFVGARLAIRLAEKWAD